MDSLLTGGIILCVGFFVGELARLVKLPKITGYLLAGILLHPQILPLIPPNFAEHTDVLINFALSFITFSVGGTLLAAGLRKLGKMILTITVLEAEMACLFVIAGFVAVLYLVDDSVVASHRGLILPMSIMLGALASPTDPSSTLAVAHEYKAKGLVTSTIMGVAAFDDVFGILNFSIALALSRLLVCHGQLDLASAVGRPLLEIFGGIGVGVAFGFVLNLVTRFGRTEGEGSLIVVVFGLLALCFGLNNLLGLDELLGTMAMGAVVVNFNPQAGKVFAVLERYTEQLVFVLFFTISGLHLNFSALTTTLWLIGLFVILRAIGKAFGTTVGAWLSAAPRPVRRYTFFGLLPQGGIVIGLALMARSKPAFASIGAALVAIVIGATVVHELIGPVMVKIALKKAGEIGRA